MREEAEETDEEKEERGLLSTFPHPPLRAPIVRVWMAPISRPLKEMSPTKWGGGGGGGNHVEREIRQAEQSKRFSTVGLHDFFVKKKEEEEEDKNVPLFRVRKRGDEEEEEEEQTFSSVASGPILSLSLTLSAP